MEFELNTGRLDSSDEATLMQFFIWGLHRDIAERVSIMHPTSLSQAIASAEEIELAVKFSRRPPIRHSSANTGNRSGQGSTSYQGNSKGRWRARGGGRLGGRQPQHPGGQRPQQPRNQFQMQNRNSGMQGQIRCHECGQVGHIRPHCPRLRQGGSSQRNAQSGNTRQNPGPRRGNGQGSRSHQQNRQSTKFAAIDAGPDGDVEMYDQTEQDLIDLSQGNV